MSPRQKRQKISEDSEFVTRALEKSEQQFHQTQTKDLDLDLSSRNSKLPRSLFVRSLPEDATSDTLAAHFSHSYPLKHATVVTDRETKKSKGYGFVTFADAEDAQKAKEEFNGSTYGGRKIRVEIAEPRHREVATESADGRLRSQPVPEALKPEAKHRHNIVEHQPPPKMIVRNLPWSIKDPEQLASLFRSYGKIRHATLPKSNSGLLSGFGFVVLRGRKNTEKAISEMNGKVVDGRTLAVDWAVEKEVWQLQQNPSDSEPAPNIEQDVEVQEPNDLGFGATARDKSSLMAQPTIDDQLLGNSESSNLNGRLSADFATELEASDTSTTMESKSEDYSGTLFIRNLPFLADDGTLNDHFKQFGPVRYARVVMDPDTERSRGTGFVCFRNPEDASECLRRAPKPHTMQNNSEKGNKFHAKQSILEDTQADPLGFFTIDGRVLQVSRAVDREQARRLTVEGQSARETRDQDKRRLYLLTEGTITEDSPMHATITKQELRLREDSLKQRQALIKSNPSLHLSLTRLSVRNIPRYISSKDLKALAREAVVSFARDVKEGQRQRLSKEELSRGGDSMKEAERKRKASGKGIVKQAKIVFESRDGGKISESSGASKSRGYGFIEYTSHRWALMGLRSMNGLKVSPGDRGTGATKQNIQRQQDRAKQLIVEFAIENAQVVARRQSREQKARAESGSRTSIGVKGLLKESDSPYSGDNELSGATKRKRSGNGAQNANIASNGNPTPTTNNLEHAKRNRIIGKKRMKKRSRKLSKA